MKKYKDCKYFIKDRKINNCAVNIVATVDANDSSCYKIQYSAK